MLRKLHSFLLFIGLLAMCSMSYAQPDFARVVKDIDQIGDHLISTYQPTDSLATMDGFSDLYFNYYEGKGMEVAVTTLSPSTNKQTEAFFTQLIGSASQGIPSEELKSIWLDLKTQLNNDLTLLQQHSASHFWEAFIQSFTILLREGFEALLIVTALLTYLRRSNHADKTRVIYYGMGFAFLASVVTAILFATVLKTAGSNREAMEGITMLIAAGVLFYVSYWLFAKRESEKWQQFIKEKMSRALSSGSLFALGLAAFLAVYREGAETILFYQALIIGNKQQTLAIILGFTAACFALLLIYRAMQSASFKIPFRLFFTLTAIFLYYMAFYFIGGGVLELQTAGWIASSPIQGFPQISWLGMFPTWQNVLAQMAFLIPTLGILFAWALLKKN